LLQVLESRIAERGHAVIVVAEGAGQDLCVARDSADASGNLKLGDIGVLLKQRISLHFASKEFPFTVKYIDPSYIVRSVAANPSDCIFCLFLGQHAAHAAMAGKTGCLVSNWNNKFVHIPIESAVRKRKQVDPHGTLWLSVLEATGQPELMTNGGGQK
jgi:6-phosphofructokinase 1